MCCCLLIKAKEERHCKKHPHTACSSAQKIVRNETTEASFVTENGHPVKVLLITLSEAQDRRHSEMPIQHTVKKTSPVAKSYIGGSHRVGLLRKYGLGACLPREAISHLRQKISTSFKTPRNVTLRQSHHEESYRRRNKPLSKAKGDADTRIRLA